MNSTKKGDQFEDEVYDLLASEIAEGRFLGDPDRCRIFKKKGYYSPDRKRDIVFDISIELSLAGEEQTSILILVECKNLSRPVEVGEAEEFYSKIEQVGIAKVKGIIASPSSFQRGTIDYSESKGMGLLRIDSDHAFKWVLARPAHTLASFDFGQQGTDDALRSISDDSYTSDVFSAACYAEGVFTSSVSLFLYSVVREAAKSELSDYSGLIVPPPEQLLGVDYLPELEIEMRSIALLSQANYSGGSVSLDAVLKDLGRRDDLEFLESEEDLSTPGGSSVLGSISFNPNRITVYGGADRNSPRTRFTIAHEIGHLTLEHGRYMDKEYVAESDFALSGKQSLGISGLERLEWQANTFASYLLMPSESLLKAFTHLAVQFNLRDKGFGWLFVDSQRVNRENYFKVTDRLMEMFHVSRQALSIRLTRLGILNDSRSQPTQIGSSLRKMQNDLF